MDGWIMLNAGVSLFALIISAQRTNKQNPRRWMRFTAVFLSGYVFTIYTLVIAGVLPESEVRFFMRWFQGALMLYIVAEGVNG